MIGDIRLQAPQARGGRYSAIIGLLLAHAGRFYRLQPEKPGVNRPIMPIKQLFTTFFRGFHKLPLACISDLKDRQQSVSYHATSIR
jgi:hypothetical protein